MNFKESKKMNIELKKTKKIDEVAWTYNYLNDSLCSKWETQILLNLNKK